MPTVLIALLAGCAAKPPEHFMTTSHQLTPCPDSPNCVSSQAPENSSKHVAPLAYNTGTETARAALIGVLRADDHATIVTSEPVFVHATFKTALGFVDDVTFVIRPDRQLIDVKSASRLGYYDFGKNRSRVAGLRKAFEARLANNL